MSRDTRPFSSTLFAMSLLGFLLLLGGCGDQTAQNDHDRIRENPVWGPSVQVMDRAGQVEQDLQDAADRQRDAIDQQAR